MASPDASSSRPNAASAGYSGTPLAKKLSLAPGMRAWFHVMPDSVRAEIDPAAIGIVDLDSPIEGLDAAHLFVTECAELERLIAQLRTMIAP
ncbi:MAG TPA: hypothetical protein VN029_14220, partial [Sphingomonas sp.]|nr:hypothetical protein [Sphingomonas sp.]